MARQHAKHLEFTMSRDVVVAGVGMVPFTKPGANEPYPQMAAKAARAALADAGIGYERVQQAYVGFVYGDSTSGQRALYEVGMTGIPVVNVNNNCSTGSTALFLARQAVASGAAECVLALGFEHMSPGALGGVFHDRPSPFERFDAVTDELVGHGEIPLALRYFGGAGLAHMQQYGTQLSTFAKIRAKASRHAANNPLALFRKVISEEEVLGAPVIWPGVMTRLMACPPTCGSAAAIVCSADFAATNGISSLVRIRAQAMTTDQPVTFEARDMREVVGFSMAHDAARQVYEAAGIGPDDVDVVELHDCFAQNELISYEALGLCPPGGAEKFVVDGDNTYGGQVVTNPSGGLLSKGHPLGATGLAQCTELVQQLRGTAEARQVDGARLALQHNLGLGGACVVTLYERT
jgi:acetyl-CoA acetyltransferase